MNQFNFDSLCAKPSVPSIVTVQQNYIILTTAGGGVVVVRRRRLRWLVAAWLHPCM